MTSVRLYETPPGIKLALLASIDDGQARNFVLEMRAGRFHGFVVRQGDAVFGFVDTCPHMGLPLAKALDEYLTPDGQYVACGWHGALFSIDEGLCVAGPCAGQRLQTWPVALHDGMIITASHP